MDYQKDYVIDADETAYSEELQLKGSSAVFAFTVSSFAAGTLDLTIQVDDGSGDWDDYADLDDNFTDAAQFTGNGEVQVVVPVIYPKIRVKMVSASSADMSLKIYVFTQEGGAGSGGTGVSSDVVVTSSALPTGAATSAKQDTLIANTALQTGIGHGSKAVTTAGTDVVLAASTACKRVIIMARTSNTGVIAVGAAGVDATLSTGDSVLLYPGDSIDFQIDNLADVYIDATVSGEGVRFTYFT